MASHEEDAESLLLLLPPNVLYDVLSYCDIRTLGRLSSVCRHLHIIISQDDYLWIPRSKLVIAANQATDSICKRSYCLLSAKDKCRISVNWRKGLCRKEVILQQCIPYMPWLQLKNNFLWYSKGSTILSYSRSPDGKINCPPIKQLRGHVDDVCRFICRDGIIVSGGRDGTICGWREDSGQFLFCRRRCHNSDVNSVDVWKNVIVSGSRDKSVKVWVHQNGSAICQHTIHIRDRVWAVAVLPSGRSFLTGSAGHSSIPPLQLYDLEVGSRICNLGSNYRNGAGVLHVYPESSVELLSCGYDTCVRLWDTRCGSNCVLQWEDPHDSAVYCVTSDHCVTFLSGTSRHGVVRLWDKRMSKHIQMFYVGQGNSPVYSVTFEPCHMYVALDRSLNLLSFSGYYNRPMSTQLDTNMFKIERT